MRLLLSVFSEHFSNIREMLSGNAFHEIKTEDEYSEIQLKHYLLTRSGKRIFAFAPFQLLAGVICLLIGLFGMGETSFGSVLFSVGSGLLILPSVLFFLFYEQAQKRRDFRKLQTCVYLYWASFLCGGLILSVGEYRAVHSVYSFFLILAIVLVLSILTSVDSLLMAMIFAIPAVLYGIAEKSGVIFYFTVLLGVIVFLWIFAEKYHCYTGMWLSEKQLEQAAQRCLQISRTDSLTGMLNKAGLTAKFYERYADFSVKHTIAVLLIDVDHFRLYNHQYGYDRSDRCLYEICNCIRIFARPVTDMVSRFGGDDFVLILEDLSETETVRFAEQIRQGVERMALPLGENGIVTISIGISPIVDLKGKETYSELLNEADIQLMIAKQNGKNCIGYRGRAFISEERRMTR